VDNGDTGGFLDSLKFLIPIVIIFILGILMKRRQAGKSNIEVAIGLLSDTKHNLKITDSLSSTWEVKKKFKTGNWNKNQGKIDFLDERLQDDIYTAFSLAEDYNERIVAARQHKSTSYLMGIQADKLGSALTASRDGLEEWVRENFQSQTTQRRRGLFG